MTTERREKWYRMTDKEPPDRKLMFVTRDDNLRIHIGWKLRAERNGTMEKRLYSADTKRMYRFSEVDKWTELGDE